MCGGKKKHYGIVDYAAFVLGDCERLDDRGNIMWVIQLLAS